MAVCGDGKIEGDESCDDSNTADGDGCDKACKSEAGFDCQGEPSVCTAICGDGLVVKDEACDDSNTSDGDGCDKACAIEKGWACDNTTPPSSCNPICGDGMIIAKPTMGSGGAGGAGGGMGTGGAGGTMGTGGAGGTMGSGGAGGTMGSGGAGGGMPPSGPTYEQCDDNNMMSMDGCSDTCSIELGYCCDNGGSMGSGGGGGMGGGMPSGGSVCTAFDASSVKKSETITDLYNSGAYNGTIASMKCIDVPVSGPGTCNLGTVDDLDVEVSMDHAWVGDVVIKVVSPKGTVTTLMSRPDDPEPDDAGGNSCSDGAIASLDSAYPVTFDDSATADAEQLGVSVGSFGTVCKDDSVCSFKPNPGKGPGTNGLADFQGEPVAGTWKVCFADVCTYDDGTTNSATLKFKVK